MLIGDNDDDALLVDICWLAVDIYSIDICRSTRSCRFMCWKRIVVLLAHNSTIRANIIVSKYRNDGLTYTIILSYIIGGKSENSNRSAKSSPLYIALFIIVISRTGRVNSISVSTIDRKHLIKTYLHAIAAVEAALVSSSLYYSYSYRVFV